MSVSAEAETAEGLLPSLVGYHHVDLTVTDVAVSEEWYRRVFGLQRVMVEPHPDGVGYAVVLTRPGTALFLGLSHHPGNKRECFRESRTGLDHVSFAVSSRPELDEWLATLNQLGVPSSGITVRSEPFDYALIVVRDPDGIQLEITWS